MKWQYNTVHSPYTIDAYSNNHASLSLLSSLLFPKHRSSGYFLMPLANLNHHRMAIAGVCAL